MISKSNLACTFLGYRRGRFIFVAFVLTQARIAHLKLQRRARKSSVFRRVEMVTAGESDWRCNLVSEACVCMCVCV